MRAATARGGGSVAASMAETRASRGRPAARLSLALATTVAGGGGLGNDGRADFGLAVGSDCAKSLPAPGKDSSWESAPGDAQDASYADFRKVWEQSTAKPPVPLEQQLAEKDATIKSLRHIEEVRIVDSAITIVQKYAEKMTDNWRWTQLRGALGEISEPRKTDSPAAKEARQVVAKLGEQVSVHESELAFSLARIGKALIELHSCLKAMEAETGTVLENCSSSSQCRKIAVHPLVSGARHPPLGRQVVRVSRPAAVGPASQPTQNGCMGARAASPAD